MEKISFILFVIFIVLTQIALTVSSQPHQTRVLGYHVISEPWIVGVRATAIAIEYDRELEVCYDLKNYFNVNIELKELKSLHGIPLPQTAYPKSPRTITAAYTSNVPETGKVMPGKYVILELSPLDPNSWSYSTSIERNTLDPNQTRGYNSGRELIPYGDNMVVEIRQLYELKYSSDGAARKDVAIEAKSADFTGTDFKFERRGEWIVFADNFIPHRYVSDKTTIPIEVNNEEKQINYVEYTLYSPVNPVNGEAYPLVVALHGSSARSIYEDEHNNVKMPIMVNQMGVCWPKLGNENCYVFAPQYETATIPLVKEALLNLLYDDSLAIDFNRIYITGLSMGGYATYNFLTDSRFSTIFAAVLINCGFPQQMGNNEEPTEEYAAKLKAVADKGTAVWIVHSDGDETVPVIGGYYGFKCLTGIAMNEDMPEPVEITKDFTNWEALNGQIRFSLHHYDWDTYNINVNNYGGYGHAIYEYTYSNPEIIKWVFAQSK